MHRCSQQSNTLFLSLDRVYKHKTLYFPMQFIIVGFHLVKFWRVSTPGSALFSAGVDKLIFIPDTRKAWLELFAAEHSVWARVSLVHAYGNFVANSFKTYGPSERGKECEFVVGKFVLS
jgi:hypothetical protein